MPACMHARVGGQRARHIIACLIQSPAQHLNGGRSRGRWVDAAAAAIGVDMGRLQVPGHRKMQRQRSPPLLSKQAVRSLIQSPDRRGR